MRVLDESMCLAIVMSLLLISSIGVGGSSVGASSAADTTPPKFSSSLMAANPASSAGAASIDNTIAVSSPDGQVRVTFSLQSGGTPYYNVSYKGDILIDNSVLGLKFSSLPALDNDFSIVDYHFDSVDETWEPVWGDVSEIRDHYNQLTVELQESSGDRRRMNLVFRVFNDGVGLRYEVPDDPALGSCTVTKDMTEFNFAGDWTGWQPNNVIEPRMIYGPKPLSKMSRGGVPLTVKKNENCYCSISVAALDNWPIMRLKRSRGTIFEVDMRSSVSTSTPFKTPWKTFQVGSDPGDLIESKLILNLNEPCALTDTSWIKPGKVMWDWRTHGAVVDGFHYNLGNETMERLIDFASTHNIPYALIDAGWYDRGGDPATDVYKDKIDVPYLISYAENRGVKLGVWIYGGKYDWGHVFSAFENWGLAIVKIDFGINTVQKLNAVLEKAAEHHLLVVHHAAFSAVGYQRTYPNLMCQEYLQAIGDAMPQVNMPDDFSLPHAYAEPSYHTTLPFVNMLGCPLDQDPGMFELDEVANRERDSIQGPVPSTITAQVARALIISTGLCILADHDAAYEARPELFQFIEEMPTPLTWDNTIVINGEIGDYITMARRSGDKWFVASETDEHARNIDIPLDFLDSGITYMAHICQDGPNASYSENREEWSYVKKVVTSSSVVTAQMQPGGGFVMWLEPLGPLTPSPPENLSASAVSSSQIDLDWNDNPENDLVDHYSIYRGTVSGFTCDSSSWVENVDTSEFSDTGLSAGTTYFYRVTATNTSGYESIPSTEVSATTLPSAAEFEFSDLSLSSSSVYLGESVTVLVLVTNTGGESGPCTVEVEIDGETKTKEVTLDPCASETVTFDVVMEEVGTYEVKVGDLTQSFEVVKPSEGGVPALPIAGVIIAIIVVAGGVWLWRRS